MPGSVILERGWCVWAALSGGIVVVAMVATIGRRARHGRLWSMARRATEDALDGSLDFPETRGVRRVILDESCNEMREIRTQVPK